jgi:NADH:ubiquinone oxidoreductase subunit 4 (subunit M)
MRLKNPYARFVLLLLWPQFGVVALTDQPVPEYMVIWALLSSGHYALRLLTVRDLGLWAGFFASSSLALAWGLAGQHAQIEMHFFALWFSLPAALLALLTGSLVKRFGAAYAGLYGGLASSMPRLSILLVVTVFSAIATPPSPGFFAMLALLQRLSWFAAVGVLLIWLFWGWTATKLMQGFVFGADHRHGMSDLGRTSTFFYMSALCAFVATGLYITGGAL